MMMMTNQQTIASQASAGHSSADISDWRPEDEAFWESTGKRVAISRLTVAIIEQGTLSAQKERIVVGSKKGVRH